MALRAGGVVVGLAIVGTTKEHHHIGSLCYGNGALYHIFRSFLVYAARGGEHIQRALGLKGFRALGIETEGLPVAHIALCADELHRHLVLALELGWIEADRYILVCGPSSCCDAAVAHAHGGIGLGEAAHRGIVGIEIEVHGTLTAAALRGAVDSEA